MIDYELSIMRIIDLFFVGNKRPSCEGLGMHFQSVCTEVTTCPARPEAGQGLTALPNAMNKLMKFPSFY